MVPVFRFQVGQAVGSVDSAVLIVAALRRMGLLTPSQFESRRASEDPVVWFLGRLIGAPVGLETVCYAILCSASSLEVWSFFFCFFLFFVFSILLI